VLSKITLTTRGSLFGQLSQAVALPVESLQQFTAFYNRLQHFTTFYNILQQLQHVTTFYTNLQQFTTVNISEHARNIEVNHLVQFTLQHNCPHRLCCPSTSQTN